MSDGMIYPGGTMEDLPPIRKPIPVIAGSVEDAISLAFEKNTPVAVLNGEKAAACPPAWERMDKLRKAAEPLRSYLAKYGDPHTCVIVTQYGATETRDERRVLFQDERQRERAAQFERELQALTGNG